VIVNISYSSKLGVNISAETCHFLLGWDMRCVWVRKICLSVFDKENNTIDSNHQHVVCGFVLYVTF